MYSTLIEKWPEILNTFKQDYDISDVSFKTWIKPLQVKSFEDNVVTLVYQGETEMLGLQYIKKKYPLIKIIVFFHNIEIQYAQEYMRTKGLRAIPFYLSVLYWEKKCCKNADYYITLNRRDSLLLHHINTRKSDLQLPTEWIPLILRIWQTKFIFMDLLMTCLIITIGLVWLCLLFMLVVVWRQKQAKLLCMAKQFLVLLKLLRDMR